jgi:flagellar hook-basal body complex protein FliE
VSALDPVRHIQGLSGVHPVQTPASVGKTEGSEGFGDVFKRYLGQVDEAQKGFDAAIAAVERGEVDNLHQVMIAQNQAQLSLKLAAEVRNKMVEAYKEVMRTQF